MDEVIEVIFENEKIKIERIRSFGVITDKEFWFDNDCDEWVTVIKGNAVLEMENQEIPLNTNENYLIKTRQKHKVKYTSEDCEWLCVYIK